MIKFYNQVNLFLGKREKGNAFLLLLLSILTSLFEVAGIVSILPFMAVLSSPEIIDSNKYINLVYNYFNFTETNYFLVFLGLSSNKVWTVSS